jgi:hypothetical protein
VADAEKDKARKENAAMIKVALKKAAAKDGDGNPKWVGFAFSPGDKPDDHILMISPRKKGPALSKDLLKAAAKDKSRSGSPKVGFGMATVGKSGGKMVVWIEYIKKLAGAERKMNEALKLMHLPFIVKLREEAEEGEAPPAPPAPGDEEEDETEEDGADEGATGDDKAASTGDEDDEDSAGGDAAPEEDEEEEEPEGEDEASAPSAPAQPAAAAQPAASPAPSAPQAASTPFKAGADTWGKTRSFMSANVAKFKAAVEKEYQNEPPALQAQIKQALGKLDATLEKFDGRLEASLHKAHEAKDDAARKAELANSKKIIADYLKHMASDPLIGHLDKNPFGVDMNLKLVLTKSLTQLAKTVS